MKSYLGLVSEYAKVHKKKNRLTVICIAISVMLVTAILGMADVSIQAQIKAFIAQQGNFHAVIDGITDGVAEQIGSRSDVKVSDWVAVSADAIYQGRELIVQGSGQELAEQMNLVMLEGTYPQAEDEALLDERALEQFGLRIGDTIEVPFTGSQTKRYQITGAYGDFSMLTGNDAHGLFLTVDGIRAISSEEFAQYYYLQFEDGVNIRRALCQIKAQYDLSDEQVSTNKVLLGLMGQSDDSAMWQLYVTAAILVVLVAMSGVFMIAGSFNMSISERSQFFGLLRCVGATKKQVKRYVLLEGLRYCAKAIPIGLLAGCIVTWGVVFVLNAVDLRFVLPEMPLFQISMPGVAAGGAVGFLVVMLASRAPAKRAAQVSPVAAVTGNTLRREYRADKAASARFRVDTSMGIQHAFSNKKNMVLTAGSVALSIVLLLSFSVLTAFMEHAATPLKPYAPDITVMGSDVSTTIDRSVMEEIKKLPHIKQIYGRMFLYDIPSKSGGKDGTVTLISYDEPQLRWAKDMLVDGDIESVRNGGGVLVGFEEAEKFNWKIGDTIAATIAEKPCELPIAGILSDTPFSAKGSEWVLICEEGTFTKLTGTKDYTIIDMQVEENISERVRSIIPRELLLLDKHQRNTQTRAAYYTMAVFVYGFVFVIALVAFINILNTVNASVSSRIGHYGVMRAVGMSMRQLKKMVIAEVVSYTAVGILSGGALGLVLHKLFFAIIVTSNWGQTWKPPVAVLLVTITASIFTTLIAVISPTRKIEKASIIDVV